MPRRKRREKAFDFEIEAMEREMQALHRTCDRLMLSLTPFRPHYDALLELKGQMRRTLNVLNDRDPDYEKPHVGFMAGLRER